MKSIELSKVMLVFIVILLAFSVYLGFKGFSMGEGMPLLNPFIGLAIFVVFGFILPAAWKLPASMRNYLRYILLVSCLVIIVGLFFNSSFFDMISGQHREESYIGEFDIASMLLLFYLPLLIILIFRVWYPLSLLLLGLINVFGFLLFNILVLSVTGNFYYSIYLNYPPLYHPSLSPIVTFIQHTVYLGYVGLLFLLGFMALAEKEKGGFLTINKLVMKKLNYITMITVKTLILLHLISIILLMIVSIDSLPYALVGIYGWGLKWIGL